MAIMRRGRHLGFKKDNLSAEDRSFSRNRCSDFIFGVFFKEFNTYFCKCISGIFNFYIKFRVLNNRFLVFSRGPGGFREVREAGRKHFHLSWYLSVSVVTSYGQKSSRGEFFYR